jgi:hypothetical protein
VFGVESGNNIYPNFTGSAALAYSTQNPMNMIVGYKVPTADDVTAGSLTFTTDSMRAARWLCSRARTTASRLFAPLYVGNGNALPPNIGADFPSTTNESDYPLAFGFAQRQRQIRGLHLRHQPADRDGNGR